MATPHNNARMGDIAKTVLMPGDPLRVEYIAKNYMEDAVCFNKVRGMLGYTGTYKGRKISVMGSGMGMPSMGIYSYELYKMYDVDNIIRVGSAGAFKDDINLKDIVIAQAACTDSNYMSQFKLPGTFAPVGDYNLISTAAGKAEELGLNVRVGNILSTDSFYTYDPLDNDAWKRMGVLCVDMEAAALYANAAALSKKALCMLTISDHLYKSEKLDAAERQEGFNDMIKLALEVAWTQK